MLWSMETAPDAPELFLADVSLLPSLNRHGCSLSTVRGVLAERGEGRPVRFQVISNDGGSLLKHCDALPDYLMWSWLPIFSARAVDQLSGIEPEDSWWPCDIEGSEGEYFLHVPEQGVSSLDVEGSRFKTFLPLKSPIPFGLELLSLTLGTTLPPLFRIATPGHPQVMAEVICTGEFKYRWEQAQLGGATFRAFVAA